MKPIIRISGKAKQVFKYIEVLSLKKGNVTLKELAKGKTPVRVNLELE
ncbi:hypothetical protein ACFLVJ_01830 [Chloroflexota bacterium]